MNTRTNYSNACKEAARKANKDGRARYVYATALGYRISLERLPFQDCHWVSGNGDDGTWVAYESTPKTRHEIVLELGEKLREELGL